MIKIVDGKPYLDQIRKELLQSIRNKQVAISPFRIW